MNTLNKTITRHFFIDDEGYNKLVESWSRFSNDPELRKTLSAEHYLAYAILRGKDWRKAFTPITNSVKLANGQTPTQALRAAVYRLKSALNHEVFNTGYMHPDAGNFVWRACSGDLEGDAYSDNSIKLLEAA